MKNLLASLLLLSCTLLFAQGYQLEFKLSTTEGVAGNLKILAMDGNSRSEMNFNGSGFASLMPKGIAALYIAKEPGKIYMLNTNEKTYMEVITNNDEDWNDYPQSDYEITVLGKEKVNGYNATHLKIKRKGSNEVQEMWTSADVAGYEEFLKVKSKYTGKDNLNSAIASKGAAGFPVRMLVKQRGANLQMDLVKAEKKNLDKSLFSLVGYTKGGLVPGLGGTIDLSIMKDIQNMSPDEQRKAMEQLMKQLQLQQE